MKILLVVLLSAITCGSYAQSILMVDNSLYLKPKKGDVIMIAKGADVEWSFIHKDHLYYLNGKEQKIVDYDMQKATYTDLVTLGMKTEEGYEVRTELINMVPQPKVDNFYFTTRYVHNDLPVYMTWQYDINKHSYDIFSDGQIDKVDSDGTLEILFIGKDYQGNYTQRAYYYYGSKKMMHSDDRIYQ